MNFFFNDTATTEIYTTRKLGLNDLMVPVLFNINRSIPLEELSEMFYLMARAKLIDMRDFSSIMDQFVILQFEGKIRPPDIETLLEGREEPKSYDVFKNTDLYSFFRNLFSGKYKAFRHAEGIDVSWTLHKGKVWFKFADEEPTSDVDKKFPLAKAGTDNDVARAACKAIKQSVEMMSPDMMRRLGFFKGF